VKTRAEFTKGLASRDISHVERAVALLWYYRQSQEFEERTASELAADLHEEGFPRPNVTRLKADLARSRFTIKGRRPGTFQIDVRRLEELDQEYSELLEAQKVEVSGAVLPPEMVAGTRAYLERLVYQINGSYEIGFYDACAVLCRRLMESLIIEVYISGSRHHEIQQNGVFRQLEALLAHIKRDSSLALGRGSAKTMDEVKQLGDTAAHDRTYITHQSDIDNLRSRYRRLISELLVLSGVHS
jgi:hypothetical protein